MDDLNFGLVFTAIICSAGYVLGDIGGLLACFAFISIPLAYEIMNRIRNPPIKLGICVVCGQKFRITDRMTSGERKICHLCINKIFKYSELELDELLA